MKKLKTQLSNKSVTNHLMILTVYLWRHFHVNFAAALVDFFGDGVEGFGEEVEAEVLVQRGSGHHVHGGRDELDLDGGLGGAVHLAGHQRVPHRVDAFVSEAGHLYVAAHLQVYIGGGGNENLRTYTHVQSM